MVPKCRTESYLLARTNSYAVSAYFAGMDTNQIRQEFAARMNEVCDALEIPKGHGRQSMLGKRFEVSPKAARKWLMGQGYPEMAMAVRIANEAGVNLAWLLQGTLPKRGSRVDPDLASVVEAIMDLPSESRTATLDLIEYQMQRVKGWFAEERLKRYQHALEHIRERNKSTDNTPH